MAAKKYNATYQNPDGTFKNGFKGAVAYFMNVEGYSKEDATKIAGKIAAEKSMKKSLGSMSYNDLRQALQNYLEVNFGVKSKHGDYYSEYPWIVDVYEKDFVCEKSGKYYIADYSVKSDGTIEVGDFYTAKKVYNSTGKKAQPKGRGNGENGVVRESRG